MGEIWGDPLAPHYHTERAQSRRRCRRSSPGGFAAVKQQREGAVKRAAACSSRRLAGAGHGDNAGMATTPAWLQRRLALARARGRADKDLVDACGAISTDLG